MKFRGTPQKEILNNYALIFRCTRVISVIYNNIVERYYENMIRVVNIQTPADPEFFPIMGGLMWFSRGDENDDFIFLDKNIYKFICRKYRINKTDMMSAQIFLKSRDRIRHGHSHSLFRIYFRSILFACSVIAQVIQRTGSFFFYSSNVYRNCFFFFCIKNRLLFKLYTGLERRGRRGIR